MKSMILLLLAVVSTNTFAQKIDWFAAADFVAVNNQMDELEQDAYLREFELALYSKIDQNWSGSMSLVYAQEANGEVATELHEALIQSSNIFPGHTLKIGQFFLGIGKLNRIHRHEWSFTTAPLFFDTYFGEEGALDTGVEYTHRIGTSQNLQLTLGVMKGSEFAHSHAHDEEEEEEVSNAQWPTHYLRLGGFNEFSTTSGLEYGLNHIVRKDAEKTAWHYTGADFTFKKREGKVLDWLVQAEYWSRLYKEEGEEEMDDNGAYLLVEKGFNQHHSVGLLYSLYNAADEHEEEGHEHEGEGRVVEDAYTETSFHYTYANSEFMKYRFSVTQETGLMHEEEEEDNYRYQIQILFNIGKHPVHLF